MKKSEPSVKIREFVGLNNRAEPRTMVPGELVRADNIDIDDRKRIRRRVGFSAYSDLPGLTSLWATPDERSLFAVINGVLLQIVNPAERIQLAAGLDNKETYWAWDGANVFVSNGAGDWWIRGDKALPLAIPEANAPVVQSVPGDLPPGRYLVGVVLQDEAGRAGGLSPTTLVELRTPGGLSVEPQAVPAGYSASVYVSRTNDSVLRRAPRSRLLVTSLNDLGAVLEEPQYANMAPPPGGPIAVADGRLVKMLGGEETTLVAMSEPYWPHLFGFGRTDFQVPGAPCAVAKAGPGQLLVGTTSGVWLHGLGEGLAQVADYGMVPGHGVAHDKSGRAYFWTVRGFCRATPFENLTEAKLAPGAGERCAIGIVDDGGFERAVALVKGDSGQPRETSPR
jgi:hypothetical protein